MTQARSVGWGWTFDQWHQERKIEAKVTFSCRGGRGERTGFSTSINQIVRSITSQNMNSLPVVWLPVAHCFGNKELVNKI
ncbi:hypothetical protein CEXT_381941 [Caerostris extrusa]|uniref:Uncharacterized protein n=1 Tax=Caerostris extrusa TaxID=172846 RepID=A0AAV4VU46_CAEEX|nr:hypothetical protein CEXT_381941 [Caerostris extrusa]